MLGCSPNPGQHSLCAANRALERCRFWPPNRKFGVRSDNGFDLLPKLRDNSLLGFRSAADCAFQLLAIKPGRTDASCEGIEPFTANNFPLVDGKLNGQPAAMPGNPEIHFMDFVVHFRGSDCPVAGRYQQLDYPTFSPKAESRIIMIIQGSPPSPADSTLTREESELIFSTYLLNKRLSNERVACHISIGQSQALSS